MSGKVAPWYILVIVKIATLEIRLSQEDRLQALCALHPELMPSQSLLLVDPPSSPNHLGLKALQLLTPVDWSTWNVQGKKVFTQESLCKSASLLHFYIFVLKLRACLIFPGRSKRGHSSNGSMHSLRGLGGRSG